MGGKDKLVSEDNRDKMNAEKVFKEKGGSRVRGYS